MVNPRVTIVGSVCVSVYLSGQKKRLCLLIHQPVMLWYLPIIIICFQRENFAKNAWVESYNDKNLDPRSSLWRSREPAMRSHIEREV